MLSSILVRLIVLVDGSVLPTSSQGEGSPQLLRGIYSRVCQTIVSLILCCRSNAVAYVVAALFAQNYLHLYGRENALVIGMVLILI